RNVPPAARLVSPGPAEPGALEVRYAMTLADLRALQRDGLRRPPMRRKLWLIAAAGAILGMLIGIEWGFPVGMVAGALTGAGAGWLLLQWLRWATLRYLGWTPGVLGARSLRISPEGLSMGSEAMGESRCAWTVVEDLRVTPEHLFIYFGEEN